MTNHECICRRAGIVVALLTPLLLVSCGARPEQVSSAPLAQRPAWTRQPVIMAGNWEPLSHAVRAGNATVHEIETWRQERTEEVARKLEALGVNLVITNFHKGFGLKTEAEFIEATRRFVEAAHRHNIRVGGYVGGTMCYETLFAEEPDARNWKQVNEWGEPVYYTAGQTHRIAYCRNNPGAKAFIQKVLRVGLRDVHLDLIHFDQMSWWGEPQSCRCRYCTDSFREFVARRYPPDRATKRFGFARVDGMVPPPFNTHTGSIAMKDLNNPLMQEWIYWRSEAMARIFGEYDNYIHNLNPEAAMDGNPFFSMGVNYGFLAGTDLGQYLQHGDFMWSEESSHASWTPDQRLVSRIRSFKAVRQMGRTVFMYTGGKWGAQDPASPPALRMAEAMAENGGNLGMVGNVTPEGTLLKPGALEYIQFFRRHAGELAQSKQVADAAVLRSFASTEFNPAAVLPSTMLFEQTLIQTRIPFDIIFDRQLNDLARYKVLVLANQDALSDDQANRIRAFVAAGGGLVATGDTSLRTEWRWERDRFALADLFGIDTPPEKGEAIRRAFGKGRVVYIPRVEPAIDPPPAQIKYNFPEECWALPKNYREMEAAVRWAAGDHLSLTVDAPLSVVAELASVPGGMLVHLVNYNFTKPVADVRVSLRVSAPPSEVILETPDGATQTLPVTLKDGIASFRVPRLQIYDLVRVRMGS